MPATLNIRGVPCSIALEDLGDRAIVESVPEEGGAQASVWFQVDYDRRYDLIAALMGSVVATGSSFVRTPPFQYPPSPNLFVKSIGEIAGIKPWVDAYGWVNYRIARFQANFGVRYYQFEPGTPGGQNDLSNDPWTITKTKTSGEVFSPPKGAYYIGPFPSTKKIDEGNIGFTRPRTEITIQRKFLPFHPLDTVEALVGKVNREPFVLGDRVYPPKFVLFLGAENEPSNDPIGNPCQDVTFLYLANSDYEWNKFMSEDGSWQLLNVLANGSGSVPFVTGDFDALRPPFYYPS